ncbi:WD40 repeat-like protein [Cryphonectria parasitica EP155]|uniref:WD40 repeat-like protein n=1 Tax=Cryphonectria parasitica (strain ATCC 38755 / EP155) TaxID=660469 RepID=A0A9P4YCM2_CRYP1|nr:WD40 repeat-like protein [Cryphonectria parasitica EP155]KAF3770605.1 WD40 repeat-like protein [Cryphonectria parasitica EP155]
MTTVAPPTTTATNNPATNSGKGSTRAAGLKDSAKASSDRDSAKTLGLGTVQATSAAAQSPAGTSPVSQGVDPLSQIRADFDSVHDSDSELGSEQRMNGADARVFSSNIVDAGGFVPIHKEPPRYIRVRAQNKQNHQREFNRMFLAQELVGTHPKHTGSEEQADDKALIVTVSVAGAGGRRREKTGGAIWATEFSKDGKFLAAAGKDGVVRVWAVISTPEERRAQEEEEASIAPVGERLSAPVFVERPVREFSGHTNEVIDLSWSKNNFLLSTSMDKTVRLWHVTRDDCLCQFKHKDVVTKVAFHPTDDRFFLAGNLDMTLRLWSIPDKQVAWNVHLPDLITAVAFTPDGKMAIAGLLNGVCMLYETEGLKFHSQIHAKSSRGKNSKGSKITGISAGTEPGEVKIMVSTNDSRIRVYNLRDGSLDTKFKGHENSCTQISASFSDDAQYVISGSENRKAFIWKTGPSNSGDSGKDKHPCESFDAHGDIVTTALFAPKKTRQLLSASGDPIYDLCNPPPVVLMSADEAAVSVSQAAPSESGSQDQTPSAPGLVKKKVEPSPAYISRTAHPGGNIIVTTDDQGILKVFRQDCAHKRRHESWETGSTLSQKPRGIIGIGRTSSIGSAAHSRRASLSTGAPGKGSSDMILSWRQNVEGGRPKSIAGSMTAPARSERSISPAKNIRGSSTNIAADARKLPYSLASPRQVPARTTASDVPDSPTSSVASRSRPKSVVEGRRKPPPQPLKLSPLNKGQAEDKPQLITKKGEEDTSKPSLLMSPPVPSFSFNPAVEEEGSQNPVMQTDAAGASHAFWNLNRWKGLAGLKSSDGKAGVSKKHTRTSSEAMSGVTRDESDGLRRKSLGSSVISGQTSSPTSESADDEDLLQANSVISKLSSELTSESDVDTAGNGDMTCRKCHAQKPKTKKIQGQQKLVCGRCGSAYTDGG